METRPFTNPERFDAGRGPNVLIREVSVTPDAQGITWDKINSEHINLVLQTLKLGQQAAFALFRQPGHDGFQASRSVAKYAAAIRCVTDDLKLYVDAMQQFPQICGPYVKEEWQKICQSAKDLKDGAGDSRALIVNAMSQAIASYDSQSRHDVASTSQELPSPSQVVDQSILLKPVYCESVLPPERSNRDVHNIGQYKIWIYENVKNREQLPPGGLCIQNCKTWQVIYTNIPEPWRKYSQYQIQITKLAFPHLNPADLAAARSGISQMLCYHSKSYKDWVVFC
jgi:hypothetical protein